MDSNRYKELMKGHLRCALTEAEIEQGWHFCPEWDFLLISADSREAESCTCNKKGRQ